MPEHFTAIMILIAVVLLSLRSPATTSHRPAPVAPKKCNLATPQTRIEREMRRTQAFRRQEARFFASFGHPQRPRTDDETTVG